MECIKDNFGRLNPCKCEKCKASESSESTLTDLLSRNGWGLRRHVEGCIIVSNKNGSSVALRKGTKKNNVGVTESLFYDMMDDFITER